MKNHLKKDRDKSKPCEQRQEKSPQDHENKKPEYGNGYIENPWSEWKKKYIANKQHRR